MSECHSLRLSVSLMSHSRRANTLPILQAILHLSRNPKCHTVCTAVCQSRFTVTITLCYILYHYIGVRLMELAVRLNLFQSSVRTSYRYNLLSVVPLMMVRCALKCWVNKPLHYLAVVTLLCCRILTMLYHIGNHYLDFFHSCVLDFFLMRRWKSKKKLVLKVEIFCVGSFLGCLFIKCLPYIQQLWLQHRSRLTA